MPSAWLTGFLALQLSGLLVGYRPPHPVVSPSPRGETASFLVARTPERQASERARAIATHARTVVRLHPSCARHRALAAEVAESRFDDRLARLREAVAPASPTTSERTGTLRWPVDGRLAAGFGLRPRPSQPTRARHAGWSFAVRAEAAEVRAVAPGYVLHAGPIDGLGSVVALDHGDGVITVYAHLQGMRTRAGEMVTEAAVLADDVGLSTWNLRELYFELRVDGIPVDPAAWLAAPDPS